MPHCIAVQSPAVLSAAETAVPNRRAPAALTPEAARGDRTARYG